MLVSNHLPAGSSGERTEILSFRFAASGLRSANFLTASSGELASIVATAIPDTSYEGIVFSRFQDCGASRAALVIAREEVRPGAKRDA